MIKEDNYNTWVVVANNLDKYNVRTAKLTDIVVVHDEKEEWRMGEILKRLNTFAYRLSACKSIQKVKQFFETAIPLSVRQFEQKYIA